MQDDSQLQSGVNDSLPSARCQLPRLACPCPINVHCGVPKDHHTQGLSCRQGPRLLTRMPCVSMLTHHPMQVTEVRHLQRGPYLQ